MKKFIALFTAVILIFSMMSFTTSAAVPTSLTVTETKTAPDINDGGKIDSAYGEKVFDLKASELSFDTRNPFPNNEREPERLKEDGVKAAFAAMRNIGYMTYDNDNLYIACEVTDIAPKAASNSSEYWKSTNLQLVMFVNEELSFPTIAYEGTNKVKVWGDERSVLDYELVECSFTEKSQTNYVYEIIIPWNAFPDIEGPDDVSSFTMGVVQTSMANGYVCSAFGEAYHLEADKTIPVTLAEASDGNSGTSAPSNTSSEDKTDNKQDTSSSDKTDNKQDTSSSDKTDNKQDTSSSDKSDNKQDTSSSDKSDNKQDTSSSDKTDNKQDTSSTDKSDDKQDTSSTDKSDDKDSTSAPTDGTDIVTDGSDDSAAEDGEDQDGTTTVITEEADRDWTPIIIIAVVAVVIIAGGAVAIIMLNKKPSEENKTDK